MDAIECMKTRRSVRSFLDAPVDRETIESIVDAGRYAATAINIQPWQFVVVTEKAIRSQLADLADHGKFLADAPVCIAIFAEEGKYYLEDGCAATQNILNAARAHDLGSCWVAGDRKPYATEMRQLLGLPDNYKLVSVVAIGRPRTVPNPPKKPLSSMLHWERWQLRSERTQI